MTCSLGYIRLHGRNCQNKFTENPQNRRPPKNDVHPSTLEVLFELKIDSMSSQNLYRLTNWSLGSSAKITAKRAQDTYHGYEQSFPGEGGRERV